MQEVDWGMVGAVATVVMGGIGVIVAIIIAIIQNKKNKSDDSRNGNTQKITGIFISKSNISQNNK